VIVIAAAMVVYPVTAARHVLGGDNGEFALIFAGGGLAHPSGYPLYTLILRCFSWFPGATPAHAAALVTAAIGIATVAVMVVTARRWGAGWPAAAVGAALFAFSSQAWIAATHAEVFALHGLLAAAILAVAAPGDPQSWLVGWRRALVLGLLAGLGLSNNHTIVLLAPIGFFGMWHAWREVGPRALAIAVGGGLLGLTPYVHLFTFRPDAAWVWGEPSGIRGAVDHFLRRDFGTFQLGHYDGEGVGGAHIRLLIEHLVGDPMPVVVPLALIGLWSLAKGIASHGAHGVSEPRAVLRRARASAAVWGATLVLSGPMFVALFTLEPSGVALRVAERFYLLPQLVCCVLAALGFQACFARWSSVEILWPPVAVVVVYLAIVFSYDRVIEHHRPTVEMYAKNVLESVPEGSIIVGTGDHRLFATRYVQYAHGVRPDVTYIDGRLLLYPWYATRVASELGASLGGVGGAPGTVSTVDVLASLLDMDREVYLTHVYTPSIAEGFRLVPHGALLHVLPRDAVAPTLFDVLIATESVYRRYRFEDSAPRHRASWGGVVYADYARPWNDLHRSLVASGRVEDARVVARFISNFTIVE